MHRYQAKDVDLKSRQVLSLEIPWYALHLSNYVNLELDLSIPLVHALKASQRLRPKF